MKRSTISLSAENFGRVAIDIGRVAENQAVQVRVDLSKFLLQEPKATASLAVESPSGERYPAITRMEGQALIWDVAAADVASAGMGKVQLNVLGPNGEVLKSAVAATRIGHSIRGEGPAPDPVQNWVDDAANKLGSAVQAGKEAEKAASKANAAAEAANTAAKNAQTVADTVQEKLDNGAFVGPAGKPGSDANVTADNIKAALGYAPVKDVQVAGSSVLVDGVAKIQIAQPDVPGVVSILAPNDSGIWNDNGSLKVSYATDAEISGRTGTRKAIACANIDYAVKASMCDGKGAAWTAAEQKAAKNRIGIDKPYELIEKITTDGVAIVERTQEPDGTPYNFVAIKVAITSPKKLSASQTVYGRMFFGKQSIGTYSMFKANFDYFFRATYTWEKDNSIVTASMNEPTIIYAAQDKNGGDYSIAKITPDVFITDENFTKLLAYSSNNTPLPAGFLIQIYGVRA